MCGHIKRGTFADLRLGRSSENQIDFEVLEPMGRLRNQMKRTAGFVICNRGMVIDREFTVQVWEENRMDRAAMNMSGFSMMVIRFGMHMEQGDCEHPHG
jgi:hypothetical protein